MSRDGLACVPFMALWVATGGVVPLAGGSHSGGPVLQKTTAAAIVGVWSVALVAVRSRRVGRKCAIREKFDFHNSNMDLRL